MNKLSLPALSPLALCLVAGFLFTSCGDDDGPAESSILGTWTYHSDGCFCASGAVDEFFPEDECEAMSSVRFESDGLFISTFYYTDLDGECTSETSDSTTYTLAGDVLTLNDGGFTEVARLVQISNERIQIIFDVEDDDFTCEDGTIVTEEFTTLDRAQ